jgi:hypothetical protein
MKIRPFSLTVEAARFLQQILGTIEKIVKADGGILKAAYCCSLLKLNQNFSILWTLPFPSSVIMCAYAVTADTK